jgi:spoIIIJ-associated protein
VQQRVEVTAASVDEALARALTELAAKRAEVTFEILDAGSGGFLGLFKGRPARVRVERLVHRHADVRELVDDLLQSMGITATVESRQVEGVAEVTIRTQGLDGLLIGRRGQTLVALQHLIGRLASREFGQEVQLQVDVGDYRRRREAQLVDKARALAEKVRITGREIHFEPLHAPDRRIVHMALADTPGVRTYTVGRGLHRNVVITPDGPRPAIARPDAGEERTTADDYAV